MSSPRVKAVLVAMEREKKQKKKTINAMVLKQYSAGTYECGILLAYKSVDYAPV